LSGSDQLLCLSALVDCRRLYSEGPAAAARGQEGCCAHWRGLQPRGRDVGRAPRARL